MQAGWLADLTGTQSVAKTVHQQTNILLKNIVISFTIQQQQQQLL